MTFVRALVAVALVQVTVVSSVATPASAETLRCNGRAALCERPLGEVVFASTHNSMAATAYQFRPPNQRLSIPQQLDMGIRGFQIDAYAGTPRNGRVFTDLAGRFGDTSGIPPRVFAAGERLHAAAGAPPPGTPTEVYLCHVFCELGAIRAVKVFRAMREFLDTHPHELLLLVIEDYVDPARIADVLDEAGLTPMLLTTPPGSTLPTLGEMVRAGTRVLIALENGDGGDTLPNAFARLVDETPYNFRNQAALVDFSTSCSSHRGVENGQIFQFNHWVTPANPRAARRVNAEDVLRERIEQCHRVRGRGPTMVAVDFAERGDVVKVVRALNRANGTP